MPIITYRDPQPQRVDKYLSTRYPNFSRKYFQNGLKEKRILVNNLKKSPSYKVKEGDKVTIKLSLKKPTAITELPINEKVEITIVAKYPDFLIINKPAGLTVHPSIFDVQNNSIPLTLAGGLLAMDENLRNVGEDFTRPAIVHRLDKDTSGLMIIPRNQEAFEIFKELFKSRKISKTYTALCWNMQDKKRIQSAKHGQEKYHQIDTFIGKSKNNHIKQSTARNPDYLANPKKALTMFTMLKTSRLPCVHKTHKATEQSVPVSLIKAKPQTGRKHQIRVHLSSIGLPLVGDSKYTSKLLKHCNKSFSHHHLDAHTLEFTYQEEAYSFKSNNPEWVKMEGAHTQR